MGVCTIWDLIEWAVTQIKLASVCVNKFMTGYWKGRDEKMDKMLNEYFKEIDENEGDAGIEKDEKR